MRKIRRSAPSTTQKLCCDCHSSDASMRKQQRKARDGCSGKAPIAPQAACENFIDATAILKAIERLTSHDAT
jgi:hypothetical protein